MYSIRKRAAAALHDIQRDKTSVTLTQQAVDPGVLAAVKRELESTRFVLAESITYISKCTTHVVVRCRAAGGKAVSLNVLALNDSDVPPALLLKRVVRRVCATMQVFDITKQHITFWLVPCKHNRWFPTATATATAVHISPKHINGGFTTVSPLGGECTVYIYRNQEFPKVMLHETLHHARIDTSRGPGAWTAGDVNALKRLCRIDPSTTFLPNEAIVETWAMLMHTAFVSSEYNIAFNIILKKEQEWSDMQTRRMLAFAGTDAEALWKEDTNSYCYIVLKTALLRHPDAFVAASLDTLTTAPGGIKKYTQDTVAQYLEETHENGAKPVMRSKCFRMSVFGDL